MKDIKYSKLYFNDLNSKSGVIIAVLMLLCLVLYFVAVFSETENSYTRFLLPFSNIMVIFIFGRTWLYRNSVQWNKKGMTLKIKQTFIGTSFLFEDVKLIKTENKQLEILLRTNEVLKFDLTHIKENEIEKLENIIKKHSDI